MEHSPIQLLPFCEADPVFYETPGRMRDDDSLYSLARSETPHGWTRTVSDLWVQLTPVGYALPEQGWKIHVSATADSAEAVCDLVETFCRRHRIAWKFLRSGAALRLLNGKYAGRGSSGKLATLYPADTEQFAAVLPELAESLDGFDGPYVLTDLRYERSPVYVRYGAFVPMTYQGPDGLPVYALRAPDGTLVPDDRSPAFTVPDWAPVPDVLRPSLARHGAGSAEDFPYRVEKALHFSNGGGVYLARDRASGQRVVLLEARPHAGLDGDGTDAVTRLVRQRTFLERLSALDCVPRLIGYQVVWEHHFLVEEHIEGKTLRDEVLGRYPLAEPGTSPEALAKYTRWALDMIAKVDHALMAVHAAGVRFGDLHPSNIMVRPDGRVVLIDLEMAGELREDSQPGLAAPGFAAPRTLTGRAADSYALDCLRQWMFLPLTLHALDPRKSATLAAAVEEHFPVPPSFGARLARRLGAGRPDPGPDEAAALFRAEPPRWPALRDALVRGIHAVATPERDDRLFPGDPQQFVTGGTGLAYGAAGVLYSLRHAGEHVPDHYTDWLVDAARRTATPRPGLFDGLHGVAATLRLLGRRDEGLELLERVEPHEGAVTSPGIHQGLSGIGLSYLYFFRETGRAEYLAKARKIGEDLTEALGRESPETVSYHGRVGFQYGAAGVALYFTRLFEATGEDRWLDHAESEIRRETAHGRQVFGEGFRLREGKRYLTYLGTGSAGLAVVLRRWLKHRPNEEFTAVLDGTRRACGSAFVLHPSLFGGRTGLLAALCDLGEAEDRPVVEAHVRRLAWHAVTHEGRLAFPGNQLLRLSTDLATGSAGVLVGLGVAFGQNASIIPFLDLC
ncbi:class III lanthionine synthetase LanKC [Streptomyces sp. ODS05-4]|uniref:class III lanthionine synthetase LanKC n=1 Tax=Streptomyces sp. ODS05-4 TaxID=2944939 RepID=UPI0021091592|nr:class III lanthionine synthetase LanKC [Streptomyces sp. ODS05-4]